MYYINFPPNLKEENSRSRSILRSSSKLSEDHYLYKYLVKLKANARKFMKV